MDDSLILAQKILSCVVRLGERFGADYVADVLRGADTARITAMRHERLSTYGLLREHRKTEIRNWIDQLEGLECLARDGGEYPTLGVTQRGRRILHGEEAVQLLRTVARPPREEGRRAARRETRGVMSREVPGGVSRELIDGDLFEALRALRRETAEERGVPPYVIFSDASLREMARERPTTDEAFLRIKGVGQHKLQDLGPRFLACVRAYLASSAKDSIADP